MLAIAAHPDDIEQTCGGTLLKMAEIGYLTGALDLTAGDMGTRGTPEIRMEEARKPPPGSCASPGAAICRCPTPAWRTTLAARMTLAVESSAASAPGRDPALLGRPPPGPLRRVELGYEACFLAGLTQDRSDLASRTGRSRSSTRRSTPT